MTRPDTTAAWGALETHRDETGPLDLRALFDADPGRAARLSAEAAGLYLDFSKNLVVDETLRRLVDLALAAGLREQSRAMFAGEHINTSEDRAVLHVALRAPRGERIQSDGRDVVADVHDVQDRVTAFADRLRSGEWRGHGGRKIRHVVNLGIGGSDLGPRMASQALRGVYPRPVEVHFVANVDPADLAGILRDLDPAETLFIVCSKTFTTLETLANARAARAWCVEALGEKAVARHFAAVSTNLEAVASFGIDPENVFGFWDWVGGRYSLASAVGLAVAVSIGGDGFRALLAGMRAMDEHFRDAPFERNLPVLLGLLGVWYRNLLGSETLAVLPYAQALESFPGWLQQLDMESNGKRVDRDGAPVAHATGPVVFGQPGTNGQHAFYQLLHQGTTVVPCDFVAFANGNHGRDDEHRALLASCFAQSEALAFGRSADEVAAAGVPAALVPHRTFPGNRPSNTILATQLDAATLGALVALYEHKIFVQGVVWGLDSFDQWGVELGKVLTSEIAPALAPDAPEPKDRDASTRALVGKARGMREGRTSTATATK